MKRNVELEAAEALLDVGILLPLLRFRLPGGRERVLRVTMRRPCLGGQMRIVRHYLKLGITAREWDAFSEDEERAFFDRHAKRLSLILALTICRGYLSGLLLAPVVAENGPKILGALAAVLLVRQTVFRGGQPDAPAAVPTAPAVTALPAPTHVTVQPLAATRDALADTQRADASAHTTPETAAVPAAAADEILPRYRALYEKNPDLIGWLRIDGTDIDLPVVQTPGDNEYYLRRGFDRFYAVGGTLFLDERCSVSADAPTANWLIYGHNMHDGSMFGQLVRYRDEDFYKAHPTFTFDTLYKGGTWQVVAAVDTALGADALPYYTFFDADTKLDWQHRVRAIIEKALYDTGVMPEYGAQLLTLSTCGDTRPDTDARFALLAVRID